MPCEADFYIEKNSVQTTALKSYGTLVLYIYSYSYYI